MGSRLVYTSLSRIVNNYVKAAWNCKKCQNIHAVCAKKEIEIDIKFAGVSKYSSEIPKKCWQCNYPFKSELFCKKCQTLQEPPDQMDYFEILGAKKSFDVDTKEIQQTFRKMQNILHPDRFGNKSDKEKQYSEYLSSLLNKAYSTLTNPLTRGLYLLELNNMSIPEGKTDLDPKFLMEIMEKNEAVEEAANDQTKIVDLAKENRKTLDTLSREVAEAFKNDDIQKAQHILLKMKYYASLDEKLKALKRSLGIME
ncbi:iron-sulfur cluster co-chaperone protein HscB [Chelonus insularis]|uniref:iron-sulfur cluster co-chaperone protein HscB n=1 Tax=Chelonus insularis TaxID=460826 RepID=UPI00158AA858|nr:iron-sulfur cluster co-chaperone protein HscB [Chelonus insularis]